jgi:hypothetical protein
MLPAAARCYLLLAACCRLTGLPPKYFPVPIALMDGIIGIFDFLAKFFPALEVRAAAGAGAEGWWLFGGWGPEGASTTTQPASLLPCKHLWHHDVMLRHC